MAVLAMGEGATAQLNGLYERLDAASAAPLWERLSDLVRKMPESTAVPAHWDYDGCMRSLLLESGDLVTAAEAERRVLILENPALRGSSAATRTLYAGLQLVLPGEIAPVHRHTQSALRFIVEGSGAHTTVDGEKILMAPGDLILTPSWSFHDHGNESASPIVWLDGLDIPIVQFLDASFAESGNGTAQPVCKPEGDNRARFGANMAPSGRSRGAAGFGMLHYDYASSRAALMAYAKGAAPDVRHGYKMQYINPVDGGHILPTIGAFLQLLPRGFRSVASRQTDGAVFSVVEGTGEARIGDREIRWKPRDLFVVPGWAEFALRADGDSVLFSFSDRPVHEKLGLFRELPAEGMKS